MALQTEIEGYEDKTLNRLIQVEQQRDELLEALKEALHEVESSPASDACIQYACRVMEDAIAKAEQ